MRLVHFSPGNRRYDIKFLCLLLALISSSAMLAGAASVEEQTAAINAQKDQAVASVQQIVNQPVTHLQQTPEMEVSTYSPGWFHPGAITPDFNHVDVRKTQELPYQAHQYVTSDLNPGEVFLGGELEFNSMTKYFYTDRSAPKKKLTEAEMLQINDLYRVIGRCNQQLNELQNPDEVQTPDEPQTPETQLTKIHRWIAAHKPAAAGAAGALLVMLILLRLRRART